jgi:ATP-binding cassette subfamily C protein
VNRTANGLLRSALHRRRRAFWRIAAWSLVRTVPVLLSGRLVARAVDQGFLAGRPAEGFAWLGVLAAAAPVGAWGARHVALGLGEVVEPLRDELVALVTAGTLRRSARLAEPGDTAAAARLTEHVEIAREAYGAVVLFVQTFAVTAAGVLLGLAGLAPVLLALVLPPLLAGLGLFLAVLPRMAARQRAVILADERLAESVHAAVSGLRDVTACGAEERTAAATGARVDAAATATTALARLAALRTVALGISGWLPLLLVLVAAPALVHGGMTAGGVLGAVVYLSQGLQPALQDVVRGLGGNGLWLAVALGRIGEAAAGAADPAPAATGPVASDGLEPAFAAASPAGPADSAEVEMRGVTFGYPGAAVPVFQDLSLRLRPGEHLAVVGPSGAGKSTLAAVLAGLLVPRSGQVRVGGVPVPDPREADPGATARRRVLIPQEAYVFSGTLRDNLAYLAPDAADAELDAAVRAVGGGPLAERLGGYDAPLLPAELSAGERQLVALARALLPPAGLVLLDEATCHLDPAAEAVAERAFARRPATLIVIAHRISSALRADRVLLLDGSRPLLATHQELLDRSALYRDLVGCWEPTRRTPAGAG